MMPPDLRILCPKVALRRYDHALTEYNAKYTRLISSGYSLEHAKIVFESDLQDANCILWQTVMPVYQAISARLASLENLRAFLGITDTPQEGSNEPDEEIDEVGDPDDRRQLSDEDDEEPEPPQPVHVPAKAPISPEMIETLRKRLNR